jgi:pilus assembly protein CpaB
LLAVAIQAKGGVRAISDPSSEEVEILIATRDLPANTIIDLDAVAKSKAKRQEATDKKYLTNETQVIGQMLIADVLKGQAFASKQFPDSDSDINIVRTLKPGKRAMSILLSSEQGIENILYPGCVVDVVATFRLPPADGQGFGEIVTATVLRQVYVLGVGPRTVVSEKAEKDGTTGTDSKRGRMITLQVDPEQGEMLQLAVTQGQVSVALRNPLDKSEDKIGDGTRLEDLGERLAEKIRNLNQAGDKTQPPQLPTATLASNGSSSQPTLVVESRDTADEQPQRVWMVQVLRGGRIVDNMKFPIVEAQDKK